MNISSLRLFFCIGSLAVGMSAASAQTLSWDGTETDTGASFGSNTWDTGVTPDWYTTGGDTTWATGDSAIFGGTNSSLGTATVTIAAGGVSAAAITFNTSGYDLTGGTLSLTGNPAVSVSSGVSAEIDSVVSSVGTRFNMGTGSGTSLDLTGGGTFSGGVTISSDSSPNVSTVYLNGGTVGSTANATHETYTVSGGLNVGDLVTQGNSTVNLSSLSLDFYAAGTYTLNNANAILNVTGITSMGSNPGNALNGTLEVKAGIANLHYVNLGASLGTSSLASEGTLTVDGGTVSVNGANLTMTSNGSSTSTTGSFAYEQETLNVSSGLLTTNNQNATLGPVGSSNNGITLGNADPNGATDGTNTGSSATINVSGGTMDLGTTGITAEKNAPATVSVNLSGGTIGSVAAANSTTAGTSTYNVAATLSNANGGVTFNTTDANYNTLGDTIVWNNVLSGTGGFTATGIGTFQLGTSSNSFANTFSGPTVINMGTGGKVVAFSTLGSSNVEIQAGTLTLDSTADIASTATLSLDNTSAMLAFGSNFTTGGTDMIYGLTVDGTVLGPGVYTEAALNSEFAGQFSGAATDSLTVAPEPGTWALVLGGLVLLMGVRRRRFAALA